MISSLRRSKGSGIQSGQYLEWYVDEPLVDLNPFLLREPESAPIPRFCDCRYRLPNPIWPANPIAVSAYWRAWELAWKNLHAVRPDSGFVSHFIDTASNECLFLWDSAFNVQFGRYGQRAFPFQDTLNNLYSCQHPDGFICREIRIADGTDQWHRSGPFSTGPNILAWAEWEYFQTHGNLDRLNDVFAPILAYHRWTRKNRTWQDGSYWTTGLGSGIGQVPRVPDGCDPGKEHGSLTWVDATFQAILSSRLLVTMGFLLGKSGLTEEREESERLTDYANKKLWDDEESFYFDRRSDGQLIRSKTLAGYWALLAKAVPDSRMDAFVGHLDRPSSFRRHHRVPNLAADAPGYMTETGAFRHSSVRAPNTYMVLKGLTVAGKAELAFEIACNHHRRVMEVFEKTGTFWESYPPEPIKLGPHTESDFIGWTGLTPITVLLEYRFGLRPIDPLAGRLLWDIRLLDEIGVDNYPLGPNAVLSLRCAERRSLSDEPLVSIQSSEPVEVEVRWKSGRKVVRA
jgi:hypothetical protein